MKVNDMQRLVRTENSMVRWISGVTLKDRRPSEELRLGLGIEGVEEVVRRGRLRWFGHVERKEADDWVSKYRNLEVVSGVKKGGGRKAWMQCVKKRHKGVWVKKRKMHRIGLYGVDQLLVTSNPRFSVDRNIIDEKYDNDDDDDVVIIVFSAMIS